MPRLACLALLATALALHACATGPPVRGASLDAGAYELEGGEALVHLALGVENASGAELVVRAVEYELRLGERMVAVGSVAVGQGAGIAIPAGGAASIPLTLPLARDPLDQEIDDRLAAGRSIEVRLRGWLHAGGAAAFPFEAEGVLQPDGTPGDL